MAQQMTVRSVLDSRINVYKMLSRMYAREIDQAYLDELKKMRCPVNTGNTDIDAGYRLFHSYLSHTWERTLEDLERDYLSVFIGANTTGHSAAYPNESVHTSPDRLIMQDARDEVLALYKAADVVVDDSWTDGEDHIALEMEYMAILARRSIEALAKGEKILAASLLMTQYHFLEDHLSAWIPTFTEEMLKFASTDFYKALAYLTRGFVVEDQAFLEEVLADEIDVERGMAQGMAQAVDDGGGRDAGDDEGLADAEAPQDPSMDLPYDDDAR